jgi:hypothetical protein
MATLVRKEGRKMNGEARKNLKMLVCTGIVILFMTGSAKATFVDANAVEEGLEYYIRIDKGVYDLGEAIEALCRITNVGIESLNVVKIDLRYTVLFELETPTGDILIAPLIDPPLPGIPDIITLNPGEYMERRYNITSLTWGGDGELFEEPFTMVGQYYISSEYDNSFADEGPVRLKPDALDFIIIPEPTSIALLGLGSACLVVHKKGRVKCLN